MIQTVAIGGSAIALLGFLATNNSAIWSEMISIKKTDGCTEAEARIACGWIRVSMIAYAMVLFAIGMGA